MLRTKNPLETILSLLRVKHTCQYTNKLYNEHPHKNNLFGLSKMLSDYAIPNAGIRISSQNDDLLSLETPFIAQLSGDFVVVSKTDINKVNYIWRGTNIEVKTNEFKKNWSGAVLIAEPDENSIEPGYEENRKKELFKTSQIYLLLATIGIFTLLAFFSGEIYKSFGSIISLIINFTGIYISHLLILKQVHVQSDNADKICSLFKKSDCNNILESPAAKFMGVISWSEMGFSYFISNTIVILLIPSLIPYMALINICALPYSFWSVWYQKVKVKQWCPLCLIVQVLLWAIFVVNVLFHLIAVPSFTITDILLTGCIYTLPYLIINLLIPIIAESRKVENIQQQMNSLRMSDEVFFSLLKKQPYYETDKTTSKILFGNPDAPMLITILTNPHCGPCAQMHERVKGILNECGTKICIQYIFASFGKEYETSSRFLIGIYLFNKGGKDVYDEWFTYKKYHREKYFVEQGMDLYDKFINIEFQRQKEWKDKAKLNFTPTVLVNGYKLPDNYNIEDLRYFNYNDLK